MFKDCYLHVKNSEWPKVLLRLLELGFITEKGYKLSCAQLKIYSSSKFYFLFNDPEVLRADYYKFNIYLPYSEFEDILADQEIRELEIKNMKQPTNVIALKTKLKELYVSNDDNYCDWTEIFALAYDFGLITSTTLYKLNSFISYNQSNMRKGYFYWNIGSCTMTQSPTKNLISSQEFCNVINSKKMPDSKSSKKKSGNVNKHNNTVDFRKAKHPLIKIFNGDNVEYAVNIFLASNDIEIIDMKYNSEGNICLLYKNKS